MLQYIIASMQGLYLREYAQEIVGHKLQAVNGSLQQDPKAVSLQKKLQKSKNYKLVDNGQG
ncbi:MAG: hypothetical protein Q8941_13200 [Bacteroidota bacterium]|nr:hypothetical protein [Bacteroidota bacterium]